MLITRPITLAYKLENLVLNNEGNIILSIAKGELLPSGTFDKFPGSDQQVVIPADVVATVLADAPEIGLSRSEDIQKIIYTYLLDNNFAQGAITA